MTWFGIFSLILGVFLVAIGLPVANDPIAERAGWVFVLIGAALVVGALHWGFNP